MKKSIRTVFFTGVYLVLICISCSGDNDINMKFSLSQAQSNKSELQKVISYYTDSEDSLKKEAANFLIRNMSAYYCLSSDDLERFNNKLFKSVKNKTGNYATSYTVFVSAMDSIMQADDYCYSLINLSKKYDSRIITAEFLIDNIEFAFQAWQESPWSKGVSFEDFCLFVLPYRAASEPLDIDRVILYSQHTQLAHHCEDVTDPQAVFNYIMNQHLLKYHRLLEDKYPYLMSIKNSEILGIGSCIHSAIYYSMVLRSIGLPVAIDYTYHWGNYSGSHYMPKLITSDSLSVLLTNNNSNNRAENSKFEMSFNSNFSIPEDSVRNGFSVQYIKTIPKIYRKTGMIQADRKYLLRNPDIDETGVFSTVCDKDVTDEYIECSEITLEVNKANRHRKIAYLSVFSEGEWVPVCASPVLKDRVTFSKMGRMIVYVATVYDNGEMKPISSPFYFSEDGKIVWVEPENQYSIKMKLVSKYPIFSYAARHSFDMKGGQFQGANRKDFSDSETLYEIDYYPFYIQKIKLNNDKIFRYYRYLGKKHKTYGFAEFRFYTVVQSDTIPLQGNFFDEFYSDTIHFKNLRDNDLNTYLRGVPRDESWIGFDTGENCKSPLVQIEFSPLNDGNCIISGQLYELFFWDTGKWVSLGKQVASSDYLEYYNAPKGALFWLKCHSRGKEERIFTYENEKQIWW